MGFISNTVQDQYGRAVAAAQIWIRDEDGALVDLDAGNPLISDAEGDWSTTIDPGTYSLVIKKGDDFISRSQVVCAGEEDAAPLFRQYPVGYFSSLPVPLVASGVTVRTTVQIP